MRRLRLPTHFRPPKVGQRWLAAATIAVLAASAATALREAPGVGLALGLLDDVLYDAFYHARPVDDRSAGDVVLVVVDDDSLRKLADAGVAWPYPRDVYARLLDYLNDCGARAVVFDLLFETPSGYAGYRRADSGRPVADDTEFKLAIAGSKVPVVLAMMAKPDGKPGPVVVKPRKGSSTVGAVNLRTDKTVRAYEPTVYGQPSLAVRAVEAVGVAARPWTAGGPFRLHYYGPHERPGVDPRGEPTLLRVFSYLSFAQVFKAATTSPAGDGDPVPPASVPATAEAPSSAAETPPATAPSPARGPIPADVAPARFKDKIVLVGTNAVGTYDLKSSPLSGIYPGIEVHATAIENLLGDQYVRQATGPTRFVAAVAGAMVAAVLTLLPRRTGRKLAGATLAAVLTTGGALAAFLGRQIDWLPLGAPLVALVLATIAAFAWSYYAGDRHRRLIVKAFAQYVSPQMAAEIEKDPARIRLTGDRHVMTVLFTDIEGFTGLSEQLPDEVLTHLLNYYFDEMSPLVFAQNGYLDKYIGDAIMSFWNAPLPQPDHARLACRAALALARRERSIQPELRQLGADRLATRIGINTGPMVVGDMGSKDRFNYTVLGDSVNLGARLEGANKIYGSRIMLGQATAELVKDDFIIRKLDVLRVVGKSVPISVYELLGERAGRPHGHGDAAGSGGPTAAEVAAEPTLLDRVVRYESAWASYRRQDWDEAERTLAALLETHPTDAPAKKLLARVADLRTRPPGPAWDGAYAAPGK
jgi:adenylate cyclase